MISETTGSMRSFWKMSQGARKGSRSILEEKAKDHRRMWVEEALLKHTLKSLPMSIILNMSPRWNGPIIRGKERGPTVKSRRISGGPFIGISGSDGMAG